MRLNLHLTHWSLLFITLISSCFLFYVVASENAKYVTTKHLKDASVASHAPMPSPSITTSSPSSAETTTESLSTSNTPAAGAETNHDKNSLNEEDKGDKILPNYKKVKKLIAEYIPKALKSDNNEPTEPPPTTSLPTSHDAAEHLTSASLMVDNKDEIIKSTTSDSIIKDNDNDSNNNNNNDNSDNDSVENKNLFNTIDIENNINANTNNDYKEIHSSVEDLNQQQQQKHQVPDVEHSIDLGIKQQQQQYVQDDNADMANGLPDITDIPTVTVTELPLEVLQQPQNTLDSVIIDDGGDRTPDETVNRTIEVIAETEEEIQKDEQIVKINDSGGGSAAVTDATIQQQATPMTTASATAEEPELTSTTAGTINNIPTTDTNKINTTQTTINTSIEQQQQQNASSTASASQVNLTAAEEVPMPVFSEWAQKQMEEAEKQQALEQEQTVNNSAQRKNNTNGNGKPAALKIRAKNYASPDCGAKIIASSSFTSNAGAVLSSSKDEYMLSLCGNRIWFVVELCEAIQAQKIDFANFELYSSSPQNFTVAVSKRFPTREWSNVGRFEAEDKRAVQSFDLHPHLFGKFVRVDINSHYSKEHFCTLSLFRVFGTSEFEAFETENHPNEDLDDFDDEYLLEQNTVKHAESNLFKSASDAVLSIVKKATEVLGKPSSNQNHTFKTQAQSIVCRTPIYGLFSCADCPSTLVEKVNNILTCEFSQLNTLLGNKGLRNDLLNTRVCAKLYGIDTKQVLTPLKDIKNSFYVNILPNEYVGALCHLLGRPKAFNEKPNNSFVDDSTEHQNTATELPSNLTIDKKFGKEDLNLLDHPEKKLLKPDIPPLPVESTKPTTKQMPEIVDTSTETNLEDNQQLPRPLEPDAQLEATTLPPKTIQKPNLPDTNIFNVPADDSSSSTETEVPVAVTPDTSASVEIIEQSATTAPPTTAPSPIATPNVEPVASKSEEDTNSWDNIEHLLTTVPSTIVAGNTGGIGGGGSAQYNNQPKNSNSPQSESVFIRLSNRIKALERNMSLSGQYLEELSRRYKKQVEELQQTLTQQIQTVRTLEEENRRHNELEQLYAQRNTQLKDELDDLTLQVHACIVVIIFVGAFVFLVLMVGILFYRSLRRETKEVLSLYDRTTKKKNDATAASVGITNAQKKINRRKSFEDFSDHQQSVKRREQDGTNVSSADKYRRPSEEVMLILKDCKSDAVRSCKTEDGEGEISSTNTSTRQRKISVCYGSNNNINQGNNQSSGLPPMHPQKSQMKRKGEKHSWPNTAQAQMQAWQHLEELNAEDHIGDSTEISSTRLKKSNVLNGKSKKKKESLSLKRQQSSPAESSTQLNSSAMTELKNSEFDERLMLDEDDLDNFIPNSDLVYNEFMPDGPRGYQCVNPNTNANTPASKSKTTNKQLESNLKKSRRLSSPVFFKSPFTKSLKGKISNSNKSNPAHESTSWEWYRLKKSTSSASGDGNGRTMATNISQNISTTTNTNNAYLRVSPNASLDSSSLSEINFPTNSTENSFRILEEAILSSGESAITTATASVSSSNCKKSSSFGLGSGGGSGSSSSNSNRSSSSNSSTQSKKKNRSFNKIFRKVF